MELENVVVPKVRHVIERDSRSYFVVSGFDHFHLPQSRPTTLLILSKTQTAILVDRIEEMAEMRTIVGLPRSFHGEERVWYRGLTILEGKVVPVIDQKGFLTRTNCAGLTNLPRNIRDGGFRSRRRRTLVNAEPVEQIPSFVVAQIGSRRIALQSSGIAELILSPLLHTFPHTTSLIVGVVLRRGRVLPVWTWDSASLAFSRPLRNFIW